MLAALVEEPLLFNSDFWASTLTWEKVSHRLYRYFTGENGLKAKWEAFDSDDCLKEPPCQWIDFEKKLLVNCKGEDWLPEKPEGRVRIVCVADIHEGFQFLSLPKGDILLICGDIFLQDRGEIGSIFKLRAFNEYLGGLPHQCKIVIAGNHDGIMELVGLEQVQRILTHAIYLQDSMVTLPANLGSLTIYGSPVSPCGETRNRAFQLPAESEDLHRKLKAIPTGLDILMTHGSSTQEWRDLLRGKAKMHVSGHYHNDHGVIFEEQTTFVRASFLDNDFLPKYSPIVFDYCPSPLTEPLILKQFTIQTNMSL